jgi:hypothetical protein
MPSTLPSLITNAAKKARTANAKAAEQMISQTVVVFCLELSGSIQKGILPTRGCSVNQTT